MSDPIASLILNGREERNLEYKQSMDWSQASTKAKVTKCALAMANLRDGGALVFGVARQQDDDSYLVTGMSSGDYASFNQDAVSVEVNNFADPFVELLVIKKMLDGKAFVIIQIQEFDEAPIMCKRDGAEKLRSGAVYTRPRRKHETADLPTHVDLRELLELAVEKKVRRLHSQIERMGAQLLFPQDRDAKAFAEQLGGL